VSTEGRGSPRAWFGALAVLLAVLVGLVVIRGQAGSAATTSSPASSGRTASPLGGASSPASPAPTTASPVVRLYSAHGEASLIPALEGRRPLFILSLGSDARPGQDIERQRSDSIHIIGIDLATHRASILGFPRDSYIPIPGHGTGKINGAMSAGGPPLLIQTIEQLTSIHIDFWMLTSFPGMVNMVNGIGGLTVDVPYPMHDAFSHANFEPGVTHLNGKQALAFARDRHDVPGGDLGRSKDQGLLLLSALSAFHTAFAKDPGAAFTWIQAGWSQVRTNLSVATLVQLALTASQISAPDVNNVVVPATGGVVGGLDVVFLQPSAKGIFADLRDDGVIEHPPA
jgi:polyisoprenyl-teichoic acid--peptidoglycan teichoic acid transferase